MQTRNFKSILVDDDQSARSSPTLVFYNSSIYDMGNFAAAVRNPDGDWQFMSYANISTHDIYRIKLLAQGILDALEFIQVWMYEQLQKWKPVEVTDIETELGGLDMDKLAPQRYEIPDNFVHWGRESRNNKWIKLVDSDFDDDILIPKEGIDKVKAIRHLEAVGHSWAIQHERKLESLAVLMSVWFDFDEKSILLTP